MPGFLRKFRGSLLTAAGLVLAAGIAAPAAAQQCPDWQQDGVTLSIDAQTAWSAQSYPMMAGGGLNLGACGTLPGTGYVTMAPHFTITYDARNTGYDLDFRVDSQCDTVMLINDAGAAWHFNDDADGTLNARLRLANAPSGIYDVWVGTYSPQACAATLILETFPAGAGAVAGGCPDWSLGGAEMQIGAGQSDRREVVAGGPVNLFNNECGTGGHGHVAQAPDFSLYYDGQDSGATLQVSVQAQCDTLLLINDPGTTWLFNDDHTSFDPQISIEAAASGRYDIWVGTYGDAMCQSTMSVASIMPQMAPPPGGAATK